MKKTNTRTSQIGLDEGGSAFSPNTFANNTSGTKKPKPELMARTRFLRMIRASNVRYLSNHFLLGLLWNPHDHSCKSGRRELLPVASGDDITRTADPGVTVTEDEEQPRTVVQAPGHTDSIF
jgi:hypothetical protein